MQQMVNFTVMYLPELSTYHDYISFLFRIFNIYIKLMHA